MDLGQARYACDCDGMWDPLTDCKDVLSCKNGATEQSFWVGVNYHNYDSWFFSSKNSKSSNLPYKIHSKMAEKNFKGAPFGTQTARFDVAGIHPQSKTPGTYTQVPYQKHKQQNKYLKWTGLAPGCYNIDVRDSFNKKVVKMKADGPGWERQYKVAQLARMPHLLHRLEAKRAEERVRRLGPGTYNHTDFVQKNNEKIRSLRGICDTRAKRFVTNIEEVPGPGTYGLGGVPSAAMEQRHSQSYSTVGMLDSGKTVSREVALVGCDLAPTRYNKTTFTEEILNKVVSRRGPYDLFTGSRSKPIITGHLAVIPASTTLGPGSQEIPSFCDEWDTEHKKNVGKFSKLHIETTHAHSNTAGERIYCTTLSQCPRQESQPAPGTYSPKVFSINVKDSAPSAPAFGTSASRYRQEIKSVNVGAGRYNIMTTGSCTSKKTNHSKSVFKSTTERFANDPRQKYLKERIRTKDLTPKLRIPLTN